MGIIWSEGFEHYGTGTGSNASRDRMLAGLWAELGTGNSLLSNGTARTGDHQYRIDNNNSAARRAFGARTQAGMAYGFRFNTALPSGDGYYHAFRNASNANMVNIRFQSDGSIVVRNGVTVLTTTDQVIFANTWHHLELICRVSATVGYIELRVDNVPVAILTDLNLGEVPMTQFRWYTEGLQSSSFDIDDIVCHTGDDFLGPARVLTYYPAGDLSPFDWDITGAASGAEAVDEPIPDGNTSYIQAELEDDVARFTMPTVSDDITSIIGVQVLTFGRQSEAGSTFIKSAMHSGADIAEGIDHALNTSYNYKSDVFDFDPADGGAWDKASFEAASLSVTRTA